MKQTTLRGKLLAVSTASGITDDGERVLHLEVDLKDSEHNGLDELAAMLNHYVEIALHDRYMQLKSGSVWNTLVKADLQEDRVTT